MLEELRLRDVNVSTEFEVTQLLQRLESSDGWAAALGRLHAPSERRVTPALQSPSCQGDGASTILDPASTVWACVEGAFRAKYMKIRGPRSTIQGCGGK